MRDRSLFFSMAMLGSYWRGPDYYLQHEHPLAKGKGYAAKIKRQAKKRRNRNERK